MKETIAEIVKMEWVMFRGVNSPEDRVSCQNNREIFNEMRSSQVKAWSEEACESYLEDLRKAKQEGRNLPEEKYIHMMAHTAPEEYKELKYRLPEVTPEHRAKCEEICSILVSQTEALYNRFPFLNQVGRPLRKEGDSPFSVSFETYQLGELLTYSDKTLDLLKKHIDDLASQGISLEEKIEENILAAKGYASFAEAEQAVELWKNQVCERD